MSSTMHSDLLPVLSRGKHRTPKRGACFMEYASYLAGERWSDHPECTHPALAQLARAVNDCVSDAARARLVSRIPSVIGTATDHPLLGTLIALRAAYASMPHAAEERQRTLAVQVRMSIADLQRIGGPDADGLVEYAHTVLSTAPLADAWAARFISRVRPAPRPVDRDTQVSRLIAASVDGLTHACVDRVDDRLTEVLDLAIADAHLAIDAGRADERDETTTPERQPARDAAAAETEVTGFPALV